MTAARFSAELALSASMRAVMLRYAHALFNQVAQSEACNHFHTLQQRCCRWMLMTHDRMQSDEFLLTQEFLAMTLAGARPQALAVKDGDDAAPVADPPGALQRARRRRYGPPRRAAPPRKRRSGHA